MKQRVPLSLVQPGMILANPVTKDGGMVLLAEGTALSSASIKRLEELRIEAVVVRGNPLGGEGESFERRKERIERLFRRHSKDPWMMRMKSFMLQYFRSRLVPPNDPPVDA